MDIYVVRGDAGQLERFAADVGKGWQGGEYLERLSSRIEYRYWAYPTRSAPQAREFMFASMNYGLRFEIEDYDDAIYYPNERTRLNAVASRCAITLDTFFIEPNRTLIVSQTGLGTKGSNCIRTELNKASMGMPIKYRSNENPSERG
ncbi:MAG: hypothetical protein ACJ8D6_11875 [Sphingomicrobium sp.]